jgi:hypothetical protein
MAVSKRAQALTMVRSLHHQIERRRSPHILWWWCSISVIVQHADDVDVLTYAVSQDWIQVSPGAHSVTLTDSGWSLITVA